MEKITKCLNEWNVIIEALGQGKQTILIRKYGTNIEKFFLYPTVSYTLNDDFLDSFQDKFINFAQENSLPTKKGTKTEVKYFAEVKNIIEKPSSRISRLRNYYIWTPNHVKSYLGKNNAQIWILRIYKLKKPIIAERTRGFRYSNLLEKVALENLKPVLNDAKFSHIVSEIQKN